MGSICSSRASRWLFFILFTFTTAQAWSSDKRYLIQLRSPKALQNFKAHAQSQAQRGLGLMGTQAKAEDFLQHLDMVVVSGDQNSLDTLQQHPDVLAIEEEKFFEIPRQETPDWHWSLEGLNQELTWGLQAIHVEQAWTITKGEGVRVMVLDSGVDSQHPDLVGRFEKAKTFMGPDFNDKVGHGTHVTGTILADGGGSGLLGVAPAARFLMGKVCDNSCSSVGITQGVNWAIEEKVDVVNMSLGGPFLFETEVYNRAEQADIVIVAAAGNSGKGSLSYPAALPTTVAVGAVNPDFSKASFSQWGPNLDVVAPGVNVYSSVPQGTGLASLVKIDLGDGLKEVPSQAFQNSDPGSTITNAELVFAGLGKPQDFDKTKTSGRIALIQRGEINFQDKVAAAMSAGAIGVIIYNNEPGLITGGLEKAVSLPVMMIEQSVGQHLVSQLADNVSVTAELSMARTDFGSFSGTSMASPHVAGLVALIRSVNKGLTAAQVRDILRNSATPLTPNPNNQLGRGLINAEAALEAAQ